MNPWDSLGVGRVGKADWPGAQNSQPGAAGNLDLYSMGIQETLAGYEDVGVHGQVEDAYEHGAGMIPDASWDMWIGLQDLVEDRDGTGVGTTMVGSGGLGRVTANKKQLGQKDKQKVRAPELGSDREVCDGAKLGGQFARAGSFDAAEVGVESSIRDGIGSRVMSRDLERGWTGEVSEGAMR